jgi:hypothetical protein
MFYYEIEFGDFESGHFIATRSLHAPEPRRGVWSCIARSDEQALELAKDAALLEWPRPATREVRDFIVTFAELEMPVPLERRR